MRDVCYANTRIISIPEQGTPNHEEVINKGDNIFIRPLILTPIRNSSIRYMFLLYIHNCTCTMEIGTN